MDVKLSIQKLKPKKSVGTDNIPFFIFKGCSHIFLRPLSHIFNLSVETNTYPSVFKKSLITPIFKSGLNADVKNYRPICILNTLAKIFEKILQADIMSKCNDSFSINQHGFLPDKSTVTNLCTTTAHAMDAINKKQQLDVIIPTVRRHLIRSITEYSCLN